jgi:hypothetical protein
MYRSLAGKPEGKRPLGRPICRWRDNIGLDWSGSGREQVESSCELGNEPSGSIKCWETTKWLHNLWPLEWYSAPQS